MSQQDKTTNYEISSKRQVRDPIYGFIPIPDDFSSIIDHKLFQRLRWISQLPLEQLVYPSAQHSRFEHSLGVMHLAVIASKALIRNSPSELLKLLNEDSDFKTLAVNNNNNVISSLQKKEFILTAALCGLLHDVGHAPFSHTFEEALKYCPSIGINYDHEKYSCEIAKEICSTLPEPHNGPFIKKALKILNKADINLNGLEKLIQNLIDGKIDVDNGDYVQRDSYHCGTVYGQYDYLRLWNNIVIDLEGTQKIGLLDKAALEGWTLRFQRYKMYLNVYKHKTRNVTDALLINIISDAVSRTEKGTEEYYQLLPFEEQNNEKKYSKIAMWTDMTMIRDIEKFGNTRIDEFLSRKLYKFVFAIELNFEELSTKLKSKNEFNDGVQRILELQKNYHKENKKFDFLVADLPLLPISSKDVTKSIRVKVKNAFIPIATYLDLAGTTKKTSDSIGKPIKILGPSLFEDFNDDNHHNSDQLSGISQSGEEEESVIDTKDKQSYLMFFLPNNQNLPSQQEQLKNDVQKLFSTV